MEESAPAMRDARAILFDFYATLAFRPDADDCVEAGVLAEFGFAIEEPAVREALAVLNAYWDGDGQIDHSAHSGSAEQYLEYQRTVHACWMEKLGIDPYHPGLIERLEELWDDPARVRLFEDALPALTRLRDAGYRLGLISNWSWGLQEILDYTGLSPLLEVAVISARAGYRKPHPAIYRHALDALALPAADVLFVGDNPHADVGGPLAAGMTPVHIDRFGYHPPYPGVTRVATLDELVRLLLD
jgi:putative hydrolase of the HAD superfamily